MDINQQVHDLTMLYLEKAILDDRAENGDSTDIETFVANYFDLYNQIAAELKRSYNGSSL